MSPVNVPAIGAYIREQREQARISLRQLAQATGVSNPYLSQIERGLRKPSADILQQVAKGLRISAEALYVQAGFLEDRPERGQGVRAAVLSDPELTERQKQMLVEIYDSFRNETGPGAAAEDGQGAGPGLDPAALTWPELAQGYAAAMPDQPASEPPVLARTALGQVVAEQAVAEHERVTAEPVTAEPVTAERVTAERVTAEGMTAEPVTAEPVTAERVTAERVTAEPAAAPAGPKRPAPRRATPKPAGSRRAGSKAAAAAEPKTGARSGTGRRTGRARPSTARTR
jgi:transcriptional regulator with XRE-family HTH domain